MVDVKLNELSVLCLWHENDSIIMFEAYNNVNNNKNKNNKFKFSVFLRFSSIDEAAQNE